MPPKPKGDRAMTGAERVRKYRALQRQKNPILTDRQKLLAARQEIEQLRQAAAKVAPASSQELAEARQEIAALRQQLAAAAHEAPAVRGTEDTALAQAEERFSEKSKLTLADAIRIYQRRLDRTFQLKLGEEVRRCIVEADDATRKQNAKLRQENIVIKQLLQQGAIFTPDHYKTILRCLHPDNSASSDVRARAFDLFKQKERRLVGKL